MWLTAGLEIPTDMKGGITHIYIYIEREGERERDLCIRGDYWPFCEKGRCRFSCGARGRRWSNSGCACNMNRERRGRALPLPLPWRGMSARTPLVGGVRGALGVRGPWCAVGA